MNNGSRRGVLMLGTDRIGLPLEKDLRQKFSLLQTIDDHYIIAYSPGKRFEQARDLCEFRLAPSALPFVLRVPLYWVAALFWTWRMVFSRRVTVLISQSPYDALILFCVSRVALLLGRRVTLIAQVQGDWEEVLPLMHKSARLTQSLWKPLMRWVIRKADIVRAVSEATERKARSLGAREVVVFPTWTNFDLFLTEPTAKVTGSATPPSALYAGVLTPVKGVDTLLRATSIVQQRGLKLEIIIAGAGPEEDALHRLAEELGLDPRPSWEGHVTQLQLLKLFDSCAVFILPSRTEGLPRVVLEAMARAKPVIATGVGGIPDLVENGRTGILVDPDDPVKLADAITELLESPDRASVMGQRARDDVSARFGTKRYLDGYSRMLALAEKAVTELD